MGMSMLVFEEIVNYFQRISLILVGFSVNNWYKVFVFVEIFNYFQRISLISLILVGFSVNDGYKCVCV